MKFNHPYSDLYLDQVREAVGYMCTLGNMNKIPLKEILARFSVSEIADGIEKANPRYLAGLCSIEYLIYLFPDIEIEDKAEYHIIDEYYWCGWAFAYMEWYSGLSFRTLYRLVNDETLLWMYSVYHEMSDSHLRDFINSKVSDFDELVKGTEGDI